MRLLIVLFAILTTGPRASDAPDCNHRTPACKDPAAVCTFVENPPDLGTGEWMCAVSAPREAKITLDLIQSEERAELKRYRRELEALEQDLAAKTRALNECRNDVPRISKMICEGYCGGCSGGPTPEPIPEMEMKCVPMGDNGTSCVSTGRIKFATKPDIATRRKWYCDSLQNACVWPEDSK